MAFESATENDTSDEDNNNQQNEESHSPDINNKVTRSRVKVINCKVQDEKTDVNTTFEQELTTTQYTVSSASVSPQSSSNPKVVMSDLEIPNNKISGVPKIKVLIKNRILHAIISDDAAAKIITILYNRIFLAITVAVIVAYNVCQAIYIHSYYINVPLLIYQLLFVIFVIFSFNEAITKQIMRTFEFWFKLMYWIGFCSLSIIVHWHDLGFVDYMAYVINTLVLLAFCLIDGLKISIKLKAPVMILVSTVFSYLAYLRTIGSLEYSEIRHFNISGWEIELDLLVLIASSIRTLCIFFWKQTITAIMHRTKSSMIKTSTEIIWL